MSVLFEDFVHVLDPPKFVSCGLSSIAHGRGAPDLTLPGEPFTFGFMALGLLLASLESKCGWVRA